MIIKTLYLENFRNYIKEELSFSNSINFFIGKNAAGKTNLIEAIGYFVLFRSFRGVPDNELIHSNAYYFYLKLLLEKKEEDHIYEVGVEKVNQSLRKKVKKNGKKVNKISDLISDIIGVFFVPDDLEYVNSISKRRSFFDYLFSLIDIEYLNTLIEYQKCLKQRNELLKRILEKKSSVNELDFWDNKLIKHSIKIMEKRQIYIDKFKNYFYKRVKEISNENDELFIFLEQNDINSFEKEFLNNRYKDIYAGTTTKGIHRDKFLLIDNKHKDITLSFSQGQRRTVALSLKLAQYDILVEKFQIKPILFIDDVIRELDQHRRKYFLDLLVDCGQAFFTTPNFEDDMKMFKELKGNQCKIFEIESGKIKNEF
ncbi:MAG: DNA replication and repair protein RecF [Leptospiraceae bacterium]|nr:MAG: DNA replication and repair protein RecF [Leptospiraceae bacterium]